MKSLPNGIGGSSGDSLAQATSFLTTGNVWYVHFGTGVDAASPEGLQRLRPLKTLSQALTNASDLDDIVFLPGHAETITTSQDITKNVRLISEGGFGTSSMATFTRNIGGSIMFNVTASRVQIRGVRFAPTLKSETLATLKIAGNDCLVKGCYFEVGALSLGPCLDFASSSGDRSRCESSIFISSSTTTRPAQAIRMANLGVSADITLRDIIVDGGSLGWSDQYAIDGTNNAVTNFRFEAISLLRDSDMGMHASSTGSVSLGTCSGSARVVHA